MLKRRRIPSRRNWPHEAAQSRGSVAGYVQWPNRAAVIRRIPKVRLLSASVWRTPAGFLA